MPIVDNYCLTEHVPLLLAGLYPLAEAEVDEFDLLVLSREQHHILWLKRKRGYFYQ